MHVCHGETPSLLRSLARVHYLVVRRSDGAPSSARSLARSALSTVRPSVRRQRVRVPLRRLASDRPSDRLRALRDRNNFDPSRPGSSSCFFLPNSCHEIAVRSLARSLVLHVNQVGRRTCTGTSKREDDTTALVGRGRKKLELESWRDGRTVGRRKCMHAIDDDRTTGYDRLRLSWLAWQASESARSIVVRALPRVFILCISLTRSYFSWKRHEEIRFRFQNYFCTSEDMRRTRCSH